MEPNSSIKKIKLVAPSGKLDIDIETTTKIVSELNDQDKLKKKLEELVIKVTEINNINDCKKTLLANYDNLLIMLIMNILDKKYIPNAVLVTTLKEVNLYDLIVKNLNKIHNEKCNSKIKYIIIKSLSVKYAHILL